MFIFGQPDPEEQSRMESVLHEARSRFQRLLLELNPEDLATLAEMLAFCQRQEGFLIYQIGAAQTILQVKHNRCAGCGLDHAQDVLANETAKLNAERDAENEQPSMKEYGLRRDNDGKLICTECGQGYVSLDDRMLRPPGARGCSGCQQKAKWG